MSLQEIVARSLYNETGNVFYILDPFQLQEVLPQTRNLLFIPLPVFPPEPQGFQDCCSTPSKKFLV